MVKAPGVQADTDGRIVQSGETVVGTLPVGDLDVFTFAASAGDTITVAVGEPVPSNFVPRVTLYGPDGAALGWDYGDTGANLTRRATLSGNHYAVVEDYWSSYDGNYGFTMVKVPGVQADTDGRVVQSGETVVGTLPVGDLDVFTFAASAGDTITVAVGETVPSNFAPRVTLYGPDGASLDWDYGDTGASVTRQATLSGNHYAVVQDYWASYDGNYQFTLSGTIRPPTGLRIVSQPTSQGVLAGSAMYFGVEAIGSVPLHYQWRRNGVNIAGATSPTLSFSSVGAADSADYSVVVWNAYGSVVSSTASLAVLTDGANGNQPLQLVYPALPPAEVGKDSLVFITHGRTPSGDSGAHPWLDDMKTAIQDKVPPNWMVLRYKWVEQSRASVLSVVKEARDVGRNVGRDIIEIAQLTPNNQWAHVHLIAHSAGARLIEEASRIITNNSPATTIHTTFLDAYTGVTDNGASQYGSASDWADSYFAVDTDTYDRSVGRTEGPLDHARNTDITWLDPNKTLIPIPCFTTAGSNPLTDVLDQICSYEATSRHRWPYDFYLETVKGTASPCATGYGFPRSKEGGGWNDRGSYPVHNNPPTILCGSPSTIQNPSLFRFGPPLQISLLSSASSGSGVSMFGNAFTLSSTSSSPGAQSNEPIIPNDGPVHAASGGDPVWLAVAVIVSNTVNFVQFDATFSTTNAAEGLMTVYWNTNEIGRVDERVGEPSLETYRFGLPGIVTNGFYTLSFRLDVFTNVSSTITVTNVATGFVGLDQPITLDMLLTGSNRVPALKLTGTSNFTYLVESSTNLLNWSPAALLPNTNGTVLFADPSAMNSSQRFYRARIP